MISIYRSIAHQYASLHSLNTVSMMNTISHQIEDQVISERMPIEFYAGFQRYSAFRPQVERYTALGAVCRRVIVFGIPDVRPPTIPGVEFFPLDPTSPLSREWFLLVNAAHFWTLLSTQEAEGKDSLNGGRRYEGIWTFDEKAVERASLMISQLIGTGYFPRSERDFSEQNRHIAAISAGMIGVSERARVAGQRRWKQINTLHQVSHIVATKSDPDTIFHEVAQTLGLVFGASDVVISLRGENGGFQVFTADGQGDKTGVIFSAGDSASERAIADNRLVHLHDIHQRDHLMPAAESILAAPIVGRRGVYGAIEVGSALPNGWTEDDGDAVMAVAALLALALERGKDKPPTALEAPSEQLRSSIAYLLSLHQKLSTAGDLNKTQHETLQQIFDLSFNLARAVGIRETLAARILEGS